MATEPPDEGVIDDLNEVEIKETPGQHYSLSNFNIEKQEIEKVDLSKEGSDIDIT